MPVYSGFFNAVNHDRMYNATHFSWFFDGLIKDGVYVNWPENAEYENRGMHVSQGTGLAVNVAPGRAWFNRVWIYNDAIKSITLDATNNSLVNRIDAIVVDVNSGDDARTADIVVVKGNESTNPDKPTLVNTATHHQYPLAYVTILGSSQTVTAVEDCIFTGDCPAVEALLEYSSKTKKEIDDRFDADENPEFEQAASNVNIESGESVFLIFGKIKKWIATLLAGLPVSYGGTGLKTHTANSLLAGDGTSAVKNIVSTKGALYSTGNGALPQYGTLPVDSGGTGLTSSPSMLVNVGSTSADTVMKASPRPGITGILLVANGGTGKTNQYDSFEHLAEGTASENVAPADTDGAIVKKASDGKYYRKPFSYIYSYIKSKLSSDNTSSVYSSTRATQDESGNNIKTTYGADIAVSDHTLSLKNKNGTVIKSQTLPDTLYPKAVKNITRSGTTFTATCYDDSTFTFSQLDSNTTYSVSAGDGNGQIKVTPSGGSAYNVSVTGLKSAAYTESSAYATAGHSHTVTMATDNGTNQLTLAANTKYKLTAGGSTFIFTTPVDNNTTYSQGVGIAFSGTTIKAKLKSETNATYSSASPSSVSGKQYPVVPDKDGYLSVNVPWTDAEGNNKVTQNPAPSTNADYEVLLSHSANNSAETDTVYKDTGLKYNPYSDTLKVSELNASREITLESFSWIKRTANKESSSHSGLVKDAISDMNISYNELTMNSMFVLKKTGSGGIIDTCYIFRLASYTSGTDKDIRFVTQPLVDIEDGDGDQEYSLKIAEIVCSKNGSYLRGYYSHMQALSFISGDNSLGITAEKSDRELTLDSDTTLYFYY